MSIWRRIILSITRLKVRTVVIAFIIFIFGTAISVATSVKESTQKTQDKVLSEIPLVTSISIDYDEVDVEGLEEAEFEDAVEKIDLSLIEEIAAYEHVDYYDYNITQTLGVLNVDALDAFEDQFDGIRQSLIFRGVDNPDILDIKQGFVSLKEGRVFKENEKEFPNAAGIISEDLAEHNNLSIGDKIEVIHEVYEYVEDAWQVTRSKQNDIEIVGIYTYEGHNKSEITNLNTVYVFNDFIIEMLQDETDEQDVVANLMGMAQPNYVLTSPKYIDDFIDYIEEIVPSYYRVDTTVALYEKLSTPLQQLEKSSDTSLYVLYISGAFVLVVSLLIYVRQKRHEMGIYKTMGETEIKIIGLLMGELIIVSIITLTLALLFGFVISKRMTEASLKENILSQDIDDTTWNDPESEGFLSYELDIDDIAQSYKVILDKGYIGKYYIGTLSLISVSSLIGIIYLVRLKPQELLM